MKKLWHTIEKILGIYKWHPKIALRYLPIVEEIKKRKLENGSILEIGSGSLGITPYIKRKITGLDLYSEKIPIHPQLTAVRGTVTDIPFAEKSFDVVVSMDMLEHLKSDSRKQAIREMLRNTNKLLIIGVPCGKLAFVQDKEISEQYQKIFNKPFIYIQEHLVNGLPEEKEVINIINSEAVNLHKKVRMEIIGNINLSLRSWLMTGWMTRNKFVDIFFRKILLFAIPIFRYMNSEPTYRKIFIIEIIHD